MIKAIIFDCFGVIYPHTSIDFLNRHKGLFDGHPEVIDELNLKIDLGEISRRDYFESLEAVTGIPLAEIQNEFDVGRTPDQNLIKLIGKLKLKYKIGLLSNAGKEEIGIVDRDKIADLFDVMTISYAVKLVKPDPQMYLTCIEELGIAPNEGLFVDDSQVNILAAEKLGLGTLYYPDFNTIPKQLEDLAKF